MLEVKDVVLRVRSSVSPSVCVCERCVLMGLMVRTAGQTYGFCRLECGIVPPCGAHHRSQPQTMRGRTSVRPSACASAIASRICMIWWFTSAKWPSLEL